MKNKPTISIVGAGLVGSLWAIFLAKRGYTINVYERRGDMRKAGFVGGRSINLAMSVRGWKAMEKAGIKEKIEAVALPMKGRMMHSTTGALTFQPYGKEDEAIYSVSRGGLNIELINIADSYDNVAFHFDKRCIEVDLEQNQVHFEAKNGQLEIVSSDLIFGADGAFSAIRSSLQKTNRFNYSQHYLPHGYKELSIPPNADGSFRLEEKNALHIWPRGDFMMIALPNTDGSFTCTLFLPFEGKTSFEHLQTDADVLAFFETHFADIIPLMPDLLKNFSENPSSSLVTIRCNPWQHQERLLLIGDASHAIVPFYGQGMNSGFEDCTILDDLMNEYGEDWSAIIRHFNQNRIQDADAIADLALRNFIEMRDSVADPKFLLRKQLEKYLHQQYPNDFLPVYSMVTFSSIPYHKALEESKAQDALFEKILAIKGIEKGGKKEAVLAIFEAWLKEKNSDTFK